MKPSKRVLIVAASPRKNSNSTILALKAVEGVKSEGGEAEVIQIGNLKIAPCDACDLCRDGTGKGCVIMDDMQPLYQKIRDAHGIVFATSIYWVHISAQIEEESLTWRTSGAWVRITPPASWIFLIASLATSVDISTGWE